jgi:hypothetical protein
MEGGAEKDYLSWAEKQKNIDKIMINLKKVFSHKQVYNFICAIKRRDNILN